MSIDVMIKIQRDTTEKHAAKQTGPACMMFPVID